jgi:hypothetical protein
MYKTQVNVSKLLRRVSFHNFINCMSIPVYDGAAWRIVNAFHSEVFERVITSVGHGEVGEHHATKSTFAPIKVKLRISNGYVFRVVVRRIRANVNVVSVVNEHSNAN